MHRELNYTISKHSGILTVLNSIPHESTKDVSGNGIVGKKPCNGDAYYSYKPPSGTNTAACGFKVPINCCNWFDEHKVCTFIPFVLSVDRWKKI